MTATTFNALAYAQRLRGAGVPEPQAEAQAAALDDAFRQNAGDFATKRDIELLRAELKQALAETKAEIIRWVVGAGMLQTALIAALLLKLLH